MSPDSPLKMVPTTGLEPVRCYSLEPESSASANSATWATEKRAEPSRRVAQNARGQIHCPACHLNFSLHGWLTPLHPGLGNAEKVKMQSSKMRAVIGLLVMLVGVTAILIKFDKMPGVRLNTDTGRFEFGGGQGGVEDDTQREEKRMASLADGLRLGGLSGPAARRLAIVNNETFAAGESAQVKVLGEMINLACLEIRTRSAIVQIEGATDPVEIFLEKAGVPGSKEKTPPRIVSPSQATTSTNQTARVEIDAEKAGMVRTQTFANVAGVKTDETNELAEVLVGEQKIQLSQ
jgi:hypothetical protein